MPPYTSNSSTTHRRQHRQPAAGAAAAAAAVLQPPNPAAAHPWERGAGVPAVARARVQATRWGRRGPAVGPPVTGLLPVAFLPVRVGAGGRRGANEGQHSQLCCKGTRVAVSNNCSRRERISTHSLWDRCWWRESSRGLLPSRSLSPALSLSLSLSRSLYSDLRSPSRSRSRSLRPCFEDIIQCLGTGRNEGANRREERKWWYCRELIESWQ